MKYAYITIMCKVLEKKKINSTLSYFLEKHGLIIHEWSEFRKNGTILSSLICIDSDIHQAFANKEKLTIVVFDIIRTFDYV